MDVDMWTNRNIYTRRVLAGEFQIVNPWLLKELVEMGLWNDEMKNRIIAHQGSIQNIPNIPMKMKAVYKTVWEISQKVHRPLARNCVVSLTDPKCCFCPDHYRPRC